MWYGPSMPPWFHIFCSPHSTYSTHTDPIPWTYQVYFFEILFFLIIMLLLHIVIWLAGSFTPLLICSDVILLKNSSLTILKKKQGHFSPVLIFLLNLVYPSLLLYSIYYCISYFAFLCFNYLSFCFKMRVLLSSLFKKSFYCSSSPT